MFRFNLGQEVKLQLSEEFGYVIGRAEYASGENNYWVRYLNSTGSMVENWYFESALVEKYPH